MRRAIDPADEGSIGIAAELSPCWVSVDSFALAAAIRMLGRRLRDAGARTLRIALVPSGAFARLELAWEGVAVDAERFAGWETAPLGGAGTESELTLRDVARRHGSEHWMRSDGADRACYTMLLPLAAGEPAEAARATEPARPEFYDFDLFAHIARGGELEREALGKLSYTVFDTETTGLDPSAGDEIVSLSAVRIVNGRLLRQETFDQLVDPRRPLPKESTAVHGITRRMLEGQPTIDRVLPRFARFAEDTILVGHNVAFDLRFLELKEAATGVRFTQPVLDTMLLSAIVHPNLDDNTLDGNARRFGIPVLGRHTSLGDAILTGEVFIRLIPLLAAQGIRTLGDALVASRQNYLARIRY